MLLTARCMYVRMCMYGTVALSKAFVRFRLSRAQVLFCNIKMYRYVRTQDSARAQQGASECTMFLCIIIQIGPLHLHSLHVYLPSTASDILPQSLHSIVSSTTAIKCSLEHQHCHKYTSWCTFN